MVSKSKTQLFGNSEEKINLYFPLLMGALFLIPVFLSYTASNKEVVLIRFIGASVFLNIGHNVFSFLFIFFFPEAKAWRDQHSRSELVRLYTIWGVVFLGFFALSWIIIPSIRKMIPGPDGVMMTVYVAAILSVLSGALHVIMQVLGLSILYNRISMKQFSYTESQVAEVFRLEKLEKQFFYLLLILASGFLVLKTLSGRFFSTELGVLMMIFVGSILYISTRYPYAKESNKTFYLTRLMTFPLQCFVPYLGLVPVYYHGVEYLFVFKKMFLNSEISKKRKYFWISLFSFATLITVALICFRYPYSLVTGIQIDPDNLFDYVRILTAFSVALNFTHILIDRSLFKMRDPRTRNIVGPLLWNDPHAPQTQNSVQSNESAQKAI